MLGSFTGRRARRREEAVERGKGALGKVSARFAKTTSTPSGGRPYSNLVVLGFVVGLGISALAILSVYLWLLVRRRARDEDPPLSPAPGEGAEAAPLEEEEEVVVDEIAQEMVAPAPPSAEEVPPREDPPPGEERPEERGATPTSPPTPREEPPPGEERPGRLIEWGRPCSRLPPAQ